MKPCSKHRKQIAWLTLNALDATQERKLRTHLESCPGCRTHWKQLSELTSKLSSARPARDLEASERFHHQVVRAVRKETEGVADGLFRRSRSFAWRLALPVMGMAALVVAVLSLGLWRPPTPQKSPALLSYRAAIPIDLQPTVFNYQMVANASLDGLDELLTRQGNRNPPPVLGYPGPAFAQATAKE